MAQSRQAIQARISSVSSTKKITKAMQLIASSKLTRQRQIMEENRSYAQGLQELFTMVLRSAGDDSMYLNENQGKPSFIFVITSDMGLCGGYNANVYRMIQDEFSEKDHVVMIGIRGSAWISKRNYNVKNVLSDPFASSIKGSFTGNFSDPHKVVCSIICGTPVSSSGVVLNPI